MKIFTIGYEYSGKSRLAKLLSEKLKCSIVDAEEWNEVERSNSGIDYPSSLRSTEVEEKLSLRPRACLDFIEKKYVLDQEFIIIDGMRNAFDFVHLFNPLEDFVIFVLKCESKPVNYFERDGIEAIQHYVNFVEGRDLIKTNQVEHIFISNSKNLFDQKDYLGWVIDHQVYEMKTFEQAVDFLALHIDFNLKILI